MKKEGQQERRATAPRLQGGCRQVASRSFLYGSLLFLTLLFTNPLPAQDSIEDQLAPPGLAQPEQPETPKLPVEVIDPTPHLPSIPAWMILLTLIVIFIPLAFLLFLALKKTATSALAKPGRNPFVFAKENLLALRDLPAETPLADLSTRISLTLRHYLAESKSDSALYQTREEFLTDQERLQHVPEPVKSHTADFLSELSSLQYAPPNSDAAMVSSLIDRSLEALERLAQPEPSPSSHAADV